MQKICFVQPRAYYLFNPNTENAKDKIGGAQTQSYYLSTALAENDHFDVHFLLADFGQAGFEIIKNVKLHNAFNFDHLLLKKTLDLLQTLKKINADIYIFHSADTGVALASIFVKLFLRKKVFYMVASNSETNFKDLRKKSGIFTALTMSITYKLADTISVQTKEQYHLFYQGRKRKANAIIKNIILLDKQKNKNEKFILWVGRLDKIKFPELFLKLARKFPEEKFIMIAPTVRDYKSYGHKIKELIKQIKNIEYIDYVKPNEIKRYYQAAKIYVLTSYAEGFSNTMAEAMANKCPVLSFNVDPDHIFSTHKTGFFAEGKQELFLKYFKILLDNKDIRKQVSENASVYLKKYHDKNEIIKNFIKLLDD